ncbi:MAG: hypothetical protein IPG71_07220 [bacterium]|nr:hypothetical protein [bacterium]
MRHGSPSPLLGLADAVTYPVLGCAVWIGQGILAPWSEGFSNPAPGAPLARADLTCNLADTASVAPCTGFCGFSRFVGEPVYFDPFTTVCYQWVDGSGVEFPLRLNSVHFTLFFEQLGSANDSTYLRLITACPSFDDACCPPGDVLAEIPITIVRGTAFQTVLDITIQLSSSAPVLSDPFWIGAIIDSVSGQTALPSFLFSSASQTLRPLLATSGVVAPGSFQRCEMTISGGLTFLSRRSAMRSLASLLDRVSRLLLRWIALMRRRSSARNAVKSPRVR